MIELKIPKNTDVFKPNSPGEKLNSGELSKRIKESIIIQELKEKPTLLIINDHHRSTPTKVIADILLAQDDLRIEEVIIATGTHKSPKIDELRDLIDGQLSNLQLTIHDGHLPLEEYVFLGYTSRQTPIYINPIVIKYKQILAINSVEPHYFAGFTGGFKSIVPGLASITTVEKNHSWALDPNSLPTKVPGNPLQDDLWEIYEKLVDHHLLGIQLVSVGEDIYEIDIGELKEAYFNALNTSLSIFAHKADVEYDIIISIVNPPLDRSLYQAQKGLENVRGALKKGGTIILVARCTEGIGNDAFYTTLKKYDTVDGVIVSLNRENYRFGDHKAHKFATLAKYSKLFILSDLTVEETENVFAKKISLEEVNELLASTEDKNVALVLDSGITVLYK